MTITIARIPGADPFVFEVEVAEGRDATRHRVTLRAADFDRLADGATPERMIEAAFRFLLDHEPKESILASFDVRVIARYFPEFERELPRYLAAQ